MKTKFRNPRDLTLDLTVSVEGSAPFNDAVSLTYDADGTIAEYENLKLEALTEYAAEVADEWGLGSLENIQIMTNEPIKNKKEFNFSGKRTI